VIVVPPAFAAMHDRIGLTYGAGFSLLSIVSLMGVGCVVLARRAVASMRQAA
jgi:hypothetical protein